MFKYSKDGISVLSVLDARRAKKSGLFPVKIQVIYNRKQKYYSTGQELSKEDWANLAESKSRRLSEIRSSVENSFSIIKSQVESLAERGEFGFDLLSIRLGRCATVTVNAAVRAKIADAERNEQYSTRNGYHSMLLGIETFAGKDIPFSTITIDWLNRLERFWSNDGKSKSTINVYFKYLKAILNQARMDGVIKEVNFPFGRGRFEMPSAEGRKLALTLEQIKKLITYTDGNEETEMYRDMWFFSYLCNGINFRDMLYLTYDNIEGDEICFVRAKTKNTSKQIRTIRAVLTPEMRNIIERWGNADDGNPDTLLFKFATGKESAYEIKQLVCKVTQRCNIILARISKALGLPRVTTYAARHSFATV
uniref:phage integrase SAM-like domain-containing protein n=1 Tax=Alistipes sp. TaxID=1872444 RepID=UPI004056A0C3